MMAAEGEFELVIRIPTIKNDNCERIENVIRSNVDKDFNEKIEYDDVFLPEDKLDAYVKSDKMVAISEELKILIPMRMKSLVSSQAVRIVKEGDKHKIIFFAGKKFAKCSRIFTFQYSIHSGQKEIDGEDLDGYLVYKLFQYAKDRVNIAIEFNQA